MYLVPIVGYMNASEYSETSHNIFQNHLNPVFIETGSFHGDGIALAIAAGFKEIYSIELAPRYFDFCHQRFQEYPQVHMMLGDSSTTLKEVLKNVNQRTTFWLDSHFCCCGTSMGNTHTPILQELALIAKHPIKNHTILIDDVRLFGTIEFDFIELEEVIDILKKINPNYNISFINGHVANDILVAEVL